MSNRQIKNPIISPSKIDLADYFRNPSSPKQKQYEVIRAIVLDGDSIENVTKRFGYKKSTVYSLLRDAKAGKIELFPVVKKVYSKDEPGKM